ncbi:hypothetical protein BsWGS_19198 [Bradybaena similaris]
MQYTNPQVQTCFFNMTPYPCIQLFLDNGSKLVMDVDCQDKETIYKQVKKIFCKSAILKSESLAQGKIEQLSRLRHVCCHECICEIPGQVLCTRFLVPPKELPGKYKFLGKDAEE